MNNNNLCFCADQGIRLNTLRYAATGLLFGLLFPFSVYAYGPYDVEVVRVIDGDTVEVIVQVWPGLENDTHVRIEGVDTPETRTSNQCEKALGLKAKAFVEEFLKGKMIVLEMSDTKDKYAGRILGDLLANGESMRKALIESGNARPYSGGARLPWCAQ